MTPKVLFIYRGVKIDYRKDGMLMRTALERVEAMHERGRLLRRARDKTINTVLGTVSFFMLAGIVVIALLSGGGLHPVGDIGQTGSSLLYEGVGGYVLVAVISFMAAVVITVLCMRWNKKKNINSTTNRENLDDSGE